MRTRIWPYMTALAALAALSIADRSAGAPPRDKTVRYVVIRLDTLGGSAGGGISINNKSWMASDHSAEGQSLVRNLCSVLVSSIKDEMMVLN